MTHAHTSELPAAAREPDPDSVTTGVTGEGLPVSCLPTGTVPFWMPEAGVGGDETGAGGGGLLKGEGGGLLKGAGGGLLTGEGGGLLTGEGGGLLTGAGVAGLLPSGACSSDTTWPSKRTQRPMLFVPLTRPCRQSAPSGRCCTSCG